MIQSSRLITMIEIAVMTAIAVVLDRWILFQMPQGGSVTLVMVPIAILAFRRGLVPGLVCGLLTGILLLIFSGYVVHPVQAILDYPLAFGLLGLSGVIRLQSYASRIAKVLMAGAGLLIAGGLRFLAHYLSGIIFFASYAPEGQPVYLYSLIYNLTYILPQILLSLIVLGLLIYSAPQLVLKQR
ncbi:energy-coupled thiamine transporter ThiT [Lihuaxuella thermophila]|uniref:Thiamine transporter n=1 Tax=Lihuaxuella thermophila TaxID=1173111 RepID=A0A1H8E8V9_9BACL|nr:energy-coupled thiamine transporter ThiT [Lihuaxuella thermophila]SEN15892.1 thiamine transporter [Lihuaxuella thermophila]